MIRRSWAVLVVLVVLMGCTGLCEGAGLLSIVQYYGEDKAAQAASLLSLRPLEGSTFCAELQR